MIKGKVYKFGDDIDTDVIVPATYLSTFDPKELAKHCMEYTNPEFYSQVKEGDIIECIRHGADRVLIQYDRAGAAPALLLYLVWIEVVLRQ